MTKRDIYAIFLFKEEILTLRIRHIFLFTTYFYAFHLRFYVVPLAQLSPLGTLQKRVKSNR
ncbi:hypothetical protein KSZ_55520 [Dictyobacter formicarum]|uniref:Uncharacterized protein n=1 Tax=Dictyobacter formicarum TaxID=2778368 RepID=A0ABQ3VPD9_9CHLR|nr:hypothetical protein KSZ_55520 [Dictyobacter formicarum]